MYFFILLVFLPSIEQKNLKKYSVTEETSEDGLISNENIKWMLLPNGRGDPQLAILSGLERNSEQEPLIENIKFYLYTRDNPIRAEVQSMDKNCLPIFKYFRPQRKTKVLVHGFGDSASDSIMFPLLRDAFLNYNDYNIFTVDWSQLAAIPWYNSAVKNTKNVSKHLALFIEHMSTSTGAHVEDFHLIGFSLGAHVVGLTNTNIKSGSVKHITGLDPAEVLFSNAGPDQRLDYSQAKLVEVVHTSGGFLGFKKRLGHRDFYPNGGNWPQPGCVIDYAAVCSHRRAYYYYSEAINRSDAFVALPCESYENFKNGLCSNNTELSVQLGKSPYDKLKEGNYYLNTNSDSPYGKVSKNKY
ncbi:lipase member H-like [Daktulosphaira vitifoliae]|uniref:lipase member H-like n=1 Tax=Daktulosphaira vitifoliae TaxID=58002 RepID=UPI0021A9D591|nr:lipase member H-like [Daktulosphaira vitifoliae]